MRLSKARCLNVFWRQLDPRVIACLASIVILAPSIGCKNATGAGTQTGLTAAQVEAANFELFRSVSTGDLAAVQRLLDKGADVNAREEEGETPLMYAAVEGHTDVALLLITRGAEVNAISNNDETALGRAAGRGREETVTMLINKGANIEVGGRHNTTPLMSAASQDQKTIVKILITKGAGVNARDDIGNTALLYAIIGDASTDTVKLLLDAGADVKMANNKGLTPLTMATHRKANEIVELLRARGARS